MGTNSTILKRVVIVDPRTGETMGNLLPRRRASLIGLVKLWLRRRRTRAALSQLTARELADIGLTPGEARREFERPFWDGRSRFL